MKEVAGSYIYTTDDGSYGDHGMVTNSIQKLVDSGKQSDISCCNRTNDYDEVCL